MPKPQRQCTLTPSQFHTLSRNHLDFIYEAIKHLPEINTGQRMKIDYYRGAIDNNIQSSPDFPEDPLPSPPSGDSEGEEEGARSPFQETLSEKHKRLRDGEFDIRSQQSSQTTAQSSGDDESSTSSVLTDEKILNIEVESIGTFQVIIIEPKQQIHVFSPLSFTHHYVYNENTEAWTSRIDGHNMLELISRELNDHCMGYPMF